MFAVLIVVVVPFTVKSPSIVTLPVALIVVASKVPVSTVPDVVRLLSESDIPAALEVIITLPVTSISPSNDCPATLSVVVDSNDFAFTCPSAPYMTALSSTTFPLSAVLSKLISPDVDITFSIILSFAAGALTSTPPNFNDGVTSIPFNVTLVSVKLTKSVLFPIPILELLIFILPAAIDAVETPVVAVIVPVAEMFCKPPIFLFMSVTSAFLDVAVPLVIPAK